MPHLSYSYQARSSHGFTLVEIMVVIVILTLFAGMMTLSVSSNDSQRNRAFYEHLQSNLSYIRLLSAEKMQPMGLAIKPTPHGETKGELVVVRLENSKLENSKSASWQLDNEIEPLTVPNNIELDIKPIQTTPASPPSVKPMFDPSQAPPIIWFGNGEATPVQISIKKINASANNATQQFDVGNPITINASGAVEVLP